MTLERTREMLGIVEPQHFCCFGDGVANGEQLLGALHDEAADGRGGIVARHLADEVAEVVGREEQLLGTVAHGGQAVLAVEALVVVALQQGIEAYQQVVGLALGLGLELAVVEAGTVFENQLEIGHHDGLQALVVGVGLQFVADHLHTHRERAQLVGQHLQGFAVVVGEEVEVVDAALHGRARQQLWREHEHPATDVDNLAVVADAPHLSRCDTEQRPTAEPILPLAVADGVRTLFEQEDAIDTVVAEGMATVFQLVVVYHADVVVQHFGTHVSGVVVGAVYL